MNTPLRTMTGNEIASTNFPPIRYLVENLMTPGLHILGGAPKTGKSWLVLHMALQIASGDPLWVYKVDKGTVLYLCLEDSFSRIQSRMASVTDEVPENIHFAITAERLDSGLVTQMENFINHHPDTKFIIIDTLQNIRGNTDGGNAYAEDYRDLRLLREIAIRHRLAILLVHHLRKQRSDDPTAMLSGSTGLSGAVDGIFILQRNSRFRSEGFLYCTGRDIETRTLTLELDGDTQVWRLKNPKTPPINPGNDFVENVIDYFLTMKDGFTGTATQLSAQLLEHCDLQYTPAVLRKKLFKYQDGLKYLGVICTFTRTHADKLITITIVKLIDTESEDINEITPSSH